MTTEIPFHILLKFSNLFFGPLLCFHVAQIHPLKLSTWLSISESVAGRLKWKPNLKIQSKDLLTNRTQCNWAQKATTPEALLLHRGKWKFTREKNSKQNRSTNDKSNNSIKVEIVSWPLKELERMQLTKMVQHENFPPPHAMVTNGCNSNQANNCSVHNATREMMIAFYIFINSLC